MSDIGEHERPRQLFDLDSGLYPLNNLLRFPRDVLEKVYNSLGEDADVLPTDHEHYEAQKHGGHILYQVEKAYGEAADYFAERIFQGYLKYRKGQEVLPPEKKEEYMRAEQLRVKYYRMIRTLSSNNLKRGLKLIEERGGLEYLLTLLPNEQTPSP